MISQLTKLMFVLCLVANQADAQVGATTSAGIGPFGSTGQSTATGDRATGDVFSNPDFVRSTAMGYDDRNLAFSLSHASRTPWGIGSSSFGMNFGTRPGNQFVPQNNWLQHSGIASPLIDAPHRTGGWNAARFYGLSRDDFGYRPGATAGYPQPGVMPARTATPCAPYANCNRLPQY